MNVYQKIAKNFSLRYASTMLCKVLNFGFIIFLTRRLGDGSAGNYFWIISVTNIVALIVDAGLATILTRECAKDKEKAPVILFNMIILKIIAAFIMIACLNVTMKGIAHFVEYPYIEINYEAIYIFGFFWIFNSFIELFCGVFIAFEKLEYDALINILHRGISFVLGIALILTGCDIVGVSIAYYFAAALSAFYAYGLIKTRLFRIKFKIDLKLCYYLMVQSFPLAFALLFSCIYFQVDKFMIGMFKSPEEVGWYGAVYRILEITMIIPQSFTIVLFPVFSRLFVESKEKLLEFYKKVVKMMFIASLPIALIITSYAKPISDIFGEDFKKGAPILKILIWGICLIFVNFILLTLLTSMGLQKINALTNALCVLVNIFLNLFLIPLWGGIGAAIATVMTEFVVFGVCFKYITKKLGMLDWENCFFKPVIGLTVSGITIYFLSSWNLIGATLSALLIYFVILAATRAFKGEDVIVLKRLFLTEKASITMKE
ncbi:flippase [bacterium]|nr:flippase [bacterium]